MRMDRITDYLRLLEPISRLASSQAKPLQASETSLGRQIQIKSGPTQEQAKLA
jgi:hypothetical protein